MDESDMEPEEMMQVVHTGPVNPWRNKPLWTNTLCCNNNKQTTILGKMLLEWSKTPEKRKRGGGGNFLLFRGDILLHHGNKMRKN